MAQSRFDSDLFDTKTLAVTPAVGSVNRCAGKEKCCPFKVWKFGKPVNYMLHGRAAARISIFKGWSHFVVRNTLKKGISQTFRWFSQSPLRCRLCWQQRENMQRLQCTGGVPNMFPWHSGALVNWIRHIHKLGPLRLCDVKESNSGPLRSERNQEK